MWCRVILTAVAISCTFTREVAVHAHGQGSQRLVQIKDVICMLLLSGLQKEEFDANTLEKLSRHNVNIDDMNNESRRQECLLNSYPDKGNNTQKHITTENLNETLEISATNKSVEIKVIVGDYTKRVQDLEIKTIMQTEGENNKTRFFKQQPLNETLKTNDVTDSFNNLEVLRKGEKNNDIIEYNIQNKSDLQSLLNFWHKLTRYNKTVVTEAPTTPTSPHISEEKYDTVKIETSHNNGYVHSREMEFIGRMLAEYLASQTVPTTTQRIFTKKVDMNLIPKIIEQTQKTTLTDKPAPELPAKNIEQSINHSLSKVNVTRVDEHTRNVIYNFVANETKSIPFRLNYARHRKIQSTEETPHHQTLTNETKIAESKPVEQYTIRFLDNLLQMKNDFYINSEPIPYAETTTKNITFKINEDNEQQEKSETFDTYNFFQYIRGNSSVRKYGNSDSKIAERNKNVMMRNDKLKNALKDAVAWEPIRDSRMKNKQFKGTPINKEERAQNQNFDINDAAKLKTPEETEYFAMHDQYEAAPSNINNWKRIKNVRINRFNDIPYINKSEQTQNANFNNNRFKVRPEDIKITKQTQNFEMEKDPFKNMLPSIKELNQNQYFKLNNNQLKVTHHELNKLEQIQNYGMYGDQYKAFLAASNESDRNKQSKKNTDQFNAYPAITKNLEQHSKGFNNHRFKFMPAMIKHSERIHDSRNQFQTIPPNINNSEQNQTYVMDDEELEAVPVYKNNEPLQAKPVYMNNEQLQTKPKKSNQNFGLNINEPEAIPPNIIKEIAEKVKQFFLRDIVKDVITTTVKATSSTTTTAVPTTTTTTTMTTAITTEKPSTFHNDFTEANHVMQKLMEIINEFKAMKEVKSTTQVLQNNTTLNSGTSNRPKLLIQTYPKTIAGFNPYLMKNPPVYMKATEVQASPYIPSMFPVHFNSGVNTPQNQAPQYVPQLHVQQRNYSHSGAITIQTNSYEIAPLAIEMANPIKVINQHIVVPTKTPKNNQEEEEERENKNRLYQSYGDRAKIENHREKLKSQSDFTNQVRFTNNFKRHEYRDRYSYSSRFNRDREKPKNHHKYIDRHIEKSNPPGSSNYPGRLSHSHTGYGHSDELSHQSRISNQDGMRHHIGSYRYTERERQYPRHEGTKFHEKLERIEKWPRNSWREFRTMTTENCCSEIPAREQVPLSGVKQRTRFDDTHFKNFLKSQQKVTDMLEKILANNIKTNDQRSVETA